MFKRTKNKVQREIEAHVATLPRIYDWPTVNAFARKYNLDLTTAVNLLNSGKHVELGMEV